MFEISVFLSQGYECTVKRGSGSDDNHWVELHYGTNEMTFFLTSEEQAKALESALVLCGAKQEGVEETTATK